MEKEIKVVLFGVGPLGVAIAKGMLEKKGMKIVGAVDTAKDLVGKDLSEVLNLGKTLGVTVTDDAKHLLSRVKPKIAIIATKSTVKGIYPELTMCVKAGVNVVSTCEELSYPYHKEPRLSAEIDKLAKKHGVAVLGTGINPGYLMDVLPITLTGPCLRVDSIKVTRMMDSSKRRIPFQKKIGTGLTPEQFEKNIREKVITGHVGLVESIAMIASALGWKLDSIAEFPPEPVIAEKEVTTPYTTVKLGHVAGLRSVAHGTKSGKPVILLEFVANALVEEQYDAISIEGVPSVNQKIIGGVHGDVGTVAVVLNMIPKVLKAAPGLATMKDLPSPSCLERT
ncbi:MAG: dihydrodipicolinate reductase [Candidatus Bathyarchaeia archaeon]|jgi:2,4-diaminopentanoate dehydrogenase